MAYGGDGRPLTSQPGDAPVPCLVPTGYATVENHIGVTKDGTVILEPAIVTPGLLGTTYAPGAPGPHPVTPLSAAGIVVSHQRGASWSFVRPTGKLFSPNDNALYVDPNTGRIFMEMLASEDQLFDHAQMLMSADSGATWIDTPIPGIVLSENARFTAAPPPAGGTRPSGGYLHVTYWCGNQNVGFTSPVILDRQCYRSLDGGVTWQMRSVLFSNLVPRHQECGTSREDFTAIDGNYPQGVPDGSLYVMVACTTTSSLLGGNAVIYLARSTDEEATFPILHTPAGRSAPSQPVSLPFPSTVTGRELRMARVGGQDVLVLVYEVLSKQIVMQTAVVPPYVGAGVLSAPPKWNKPVSLTPSGLASIDHWAVDTRGGELALSYVASPSSSVYHGYLSVTPNVVTVPEIWTTTVNDPKTPLATSASPPGKDDFIGITIGPDGTPWASYFAPCSAEPSAPTDPACKGAYFNGQPINGAIQGGNFRGLVASLAFSG
jgi:hypothetical protein